MADNLTNGMVMDVDLNQEPLESSSVTPLGLGSINDFETAHCRIEQRILHLEAIAGRAWQHHRQRQAHTSADTGNNEMQDHNIAGIEERTRGCKRDRSHLVAKALETDLVVKKVDKCGGNFFDCNICLDIAKEPMLTCCGHLFCWPCFYQLPSDNSTTRECPVCKGEVSEANVTPIYGNGHSYHSKEVGSGLKIPPRPKAHRKESVRQNRATRAFSHIPVVEALRRIRTSIGLGDHPQQPETSGISPSSVSSSQEPQNADATGSRRLRSHVFSRVSSESAASLSSELENAQRVFEDLAVSLSERMHESNVQVLPSAYVVADEGNSLRRDAANIQSERQTQDSMAEASSATFAPSSSQSSEVSDAARLLENLTTDSGNTPVIQSSLSFRRRIGLPRLSDLDSGHLRETRRRRLD